MSGSKNIFAVDKPQAKQMQTAPAAAEEARAIQEVQASLVIAKKFPRDQVEAMDRILMACTRPTLAAGALYSYSRGGTEITGPSIRLAEAIAQAWGNISFGIRELSTGDKSSTIEAYAWDLETNTRQSKVFSVPHRRHTRSGGYDLTDPRDIYETTANNGARRMRACILGVIPGDVTEAAVKQCAETMKTSVDTSPDAIKKMIDAFEPFGVKKEHIEQRIQCRIEAIRPAQVVAMGKVYNSLKDGMSKPGDWFDMEAATVEDLNAKFAEPEKKAEKKPEPESEEEKTKPVRSKPAVVRKFKGEIDAIENHIHMDRWRMKHLSRIERELPKKEDREAVFAYAESHYKTLKHKHENSGEEPQEERFFDCPDGNGKTPDSYCVNECKKVKGCPARA